MPHQPRDGYYTVDEAAAYLGTSRSNLEKKLYRDRTLVPDRNYEGRLLLFSQATLDAFKARWRRQPRKARLDTSDHNGYNVTQTD